LAGGNVRVGLEDNLYLEKGVFASNAQLVERAATILSSLNVNILGPDEVRKKLALKKH
ncbi:MAG: 3-keto-5-aminohexanoate cleavage protein, partial [Gammaproteobacteria bacterium]|nr:3-keto-5-aminohexanoate cleavage protein [Gammaproteobacteria bacterium]